MDKAAAVYPGSALPAPSSVPTWWQPLMTFRPNSILMINKSGIIHLILLLSLFVSMFDHIKFNVLTFHSHYKSNPSNLRNWINSTQHFFSGVYKFPAMHSLLVTIICYEVCKCKY